VAKSPAKKPTTPKSSILDDGPTEGAEAKPAEKPWFETEETETVVAPAGKPDKKSKSKTEDSKPPADTLGLNDEENDVSKDKKTTKKAATPKKDKAAKRTKYEGLVLKPTAKAEKLREGNLRHTVVNAFKGGVKFETALAKLEKSVSKAPRGGKADISKIIQAKIYNMHRLGFLA